MADALYSHKSGEVTIELVVEYVCTYDWVLAGDELDLDFAAKAAASEHIRG